MRLLENSKGLRADRGRSRAQGLGNAPIIRTGSSVFRTVGRFFTGKESFQLSHTCCSKAACAEAGKGNQSQFRSFRRFRFQAASLASDRSPTSQVVSVS